MKAIQGNFHGFSCSLISPFGYAILITKINICLKMCPKNEIAECRKSEEEMFTKMPLYLFTL